MNLGQKGVIETLANGATVVKEINFALVPEEDIALAIAEQGLVTLGVQDVAAGDQGVLEHFLSLVEVEAGDVVRLDVTSESETVIFG